MIVTALAREIARHDYDLAHPQPQYHVDRLGNLTPTIPMPGGVTNDKELDVIISSSVDFFEVVARMWAAQGTPTPSYAKPRR